jgi:BCD family chlorophyll transporter-like MFS transporter
VQATATGVGVAAGGALRDLLSGLAAGGALGPAFSGPSTGYGFVYQLEVVLLFATLIAIGPLARHAARDEGMKSSGIGLADLPG